MEPLLIFGVLSVIAGLMLLLLPETYGQKLPDTIEEGEELGRWLLNYSDFQIGSFVHSNIAVILNL